MTPRPTPDVRYSQAAVSVDALARQWARQEAAAAGAACVVEREISARRRGGVPWQHDDATAVAVVARPEQIRIDATDLLWLAAGLGAADAINSLTGQPHRCIWPDRVEVDAKLDVASTALYELGPGRIDYAVLVARVANTAELGGSSCVSGALVDALRASAQLLDDPVKLLRAYRNRCATIGAHVSATLLPHGSARGFVDGIDDHGALVLLSPTGLIDLIAVPTLNELTIIDEEG